MWFWSVSWSTICPVYFSFFLVDQKKIVQSQRPDKKILVSLWFFLVSLSSRGCTKKNQRLTKKNSETDQHFFVRSLRLDNFFWSTTKMKNRPDNSSTKRLTKSTWMPLWSTNRLTKSTWTLLLCSPQAPLPIDIRPCKSYDGNGVPLK